MPSNTTDNVSDPNLLVVDRLTLNFAGVRALNEVSLRVAAGQIHALIGPNGAGKSSLFNCLSRLYTPTTGTVTFRGQDLLARAPHQIAALGIGRTFQNVALFGTMTVSENLMLGAHHWSTDTVGHAVLRTRRLRRTEQAIRVKVDELIEYLGLGSVRTRRAGELPFPTQKLIELGRALMSNPSLLLLDEPAGGLTHGEVSALSELLIRLRQDYALTMILVEHRMSMVMAMSDVVTVLDSGRVIAHGTPHDVQRNPIVIAAYLGERASRAARADG